MFRSDDCAARDKFQPVTLLDRMVMIGALALIVLYGMWKVRGTQTVDTYFRGSNTLAWPAIGLSIMATQASAITFLSAPGQAYEDGLRFVQIYFGLPLAMIVISAFVLPIYYRLNVYTAYEYLEPVRRARALRRRVLYKLGRCALRAAQ